MKEQKEQEFILQPNKDMTYFLWFNPNTSKYEPVCKYFKLRGITCNIPKNSAIDEVVYEITEKDGVREVRISVEDITDFKATAKSCARQHFLISGKYEGLIYSIMRDYAMYGMNYEKNLYQHSCLGWQNVDGRDYFLLEENFFKNGSKSRCILDFGRFTAGSEQIYDDMLKNYVYKKPELSLAYTLSFSGVIVSRLSNIKSLPNLCVGLSGRSGTGKSTAAKLIASVWADPDNNKGGIIMNNDASEVGFSAQYSGFFGVPVIFDDVDAETNRDLGKIIYRISKGTQRIVSNGNGGVDRSRLGMSGVCIFTSETSILEKTSKSMGLYPRFLDLSDVSWTSDAESSDKIQNCCSENFGHKGKQFAAFIENIDVKKLAKGFDVCNDNLLKHVKNKDSLTARSVKKYAVICLTAQLLNKCFNIKLNITEMMKILLGFEQEQVYERDKGTLSYKFIHDFFLDHYQNFNIYRNRKLTSAVLGQMTCYGNASYKNDELHLYISTVTCRKILESNGFPQVDNYKKFWKERGFTKCQGNRYDVSASDRLYQRHFHFVYKIENASECSAANEIKFEDIETQILNQEEI